MIPVSCAPEPRSFDATVRQPGLSAIDELVGRSPRLKRRGPKRKKIASRESDIPAAAFPPFWRLALDEMLDAYERRCAFLALYLEHATGSASVDHMLPKSRVWQKVYEWDNYRLCAALINSRKNDLVGVVDPFACGDGWFALELVGFQVIRGEKAPASRAKEIDATLPLLNVEECCKQRGTYVTEYEAGHVDLDYVTRRAPFVASELRRQQRVRPEDEPLALKPHRAARKSDAKETR